MQWLMDSLQMAWDDYASIFEDYSNAAVYVDRITSTVQAVKVSDIGDFYSSFSVLLQGGYLSKYKPVYIKLEKYVAFPTLRENVAVRLSRLKGWRRVSYYVEWNHVASWVIKDCFRCEAEQKAHMEIKEAGLSDDDLVRIHSSL
ncbi:hypothetical protein [Sulfuracidifex tepidarius]|uniref:Uncharacterized protein n=1 Tax=Sulfuracidifex tepidarius TaxID=1294262 RepID=A0A510E4L5_9CREN|nr:hypothetical protein [Sulfuracidifex tepidarius]BBG24685.1 hypothetical protein IC006_2019 [Sulfuracidifex tepidarius]BBG27473.1 hypothetical protein IC007_2027 [Sulfuracidifex tepidarius]